MPRHNIFVFYFLKFFGILNPEHAEQNKILSKLVHKGQIDIKSTLAQVIVWYWEGTKPLPEPMLTHIYDSCTCNELTDFSPDQAVDNAESDNFKSIFLTKKFWILKGFLLHFCRLLPLKNQDWSIKGLAQNK